MKYIVYMEIIRKFTTVVDANSEDEAIAKAGREEHIEGCAHWAPIQEERFRMSATLIGGSK